jgi:hypothetical protein
MTLQAAPWCPAMRGGNAKRVRAVLPINLALTFPFLSQQGRGRGLEEGEGLQRAMVFPAISGKRRG